MEPDETAERADPETPEQRVTWFEMLDSMAFPPLLFPRPAPQATGRENAAPSGLEETLRRSFLAVHPEIGEDHGHLLITQALCQARQKHEDLDRLLSDMGVVANAIPPRWGAIALDEYIEALYCVTKYADFAKEVREAARHRRCQEPVQ